MKTNILIILSGFLLTACSETISQYIPSVDLVKEEAAVVIPETQPLNLNDGVKWVVLTYDDLKEITKKLENNKELQNTYVIFALTPEGYEALALNMAEIKRYISDNEKINEFLVGVIKDREGKTDRE